MSVLRFLLLLLACLALAGPARAGATPQADIHAAHATHAAASSAHGVEAPAAEAAACSDHAGRGAAHGGHAGHGAGDGCCAPAAGDCAGHCASAVPVLPASATVGTWDTPRGPPVARLRGARLAPPPAPLLRPPIA